MNTRMHLKKLNIATFTFLLLLLEWSCHKTVPDAMISQESFIRSYSKPGSQIGTNIMETPDQGFIIFGISDNNVFSSLRLDPHGKIISEQVYDTLSYNFTKLGDGGILVSSITSGRLLKIDKEGKLKFKTIYPGPDVSSYPIQVNSVNYPDYFMVANTSFNTTPSATQVDVFDAGGDHKKVINFPSSLFYGNVLFLDLYKYEDPDIYYFYGIIFDKPIWSWSDNAHMFAAKIVKNAGIFETQKFVIFDPNNQSRNNRYWDWFPVQALTDDGGVIICTSVPDKGLNCTAARMVRLDANQNILWQKDLDIEGRAIGISWIEKCSDGTFILTGGHNLPNKSISEPFLCKMDINGKILWQNSFPGNYFGNAWFTTQLNDKSYVLTGQITSFGNSLTDNDIYIIKTDKNGILK